MIIRVILIAAAIWLVWRVVSKVLLGGPQDSRQDPQNSNPDTPARMLKCEQCGVHIPEPEAFSAQGHHFCCNAHQQAWLAQHDHD